MIILSLGSNLGDKNYQLRGAIFRLERAGVFIDEVSSHYENPPWGFESTEDFINIVLKINHIAYLPIQLLKLIQTIEFQMGRRRDKEGRGYQSRLIDIDIVAYHDIICNTLELVLPHPHMHKRDFVLKPLCEIAPQWVHPILQKNALQLLDELNRI